LICGAKLRKKADWWFPIGLKMCKLQMQTFAYFNESLLYESLFFQFNELPEKWTESQGLILY